MNTNDRIKKSDRNIYRVAVATVIALAICAAVLSYSSLQVLAEDSGIHPALSYLFPLTIDGLILCGSMLVLFAANRGRRSWGGVSLTGLGVISSIAGNVAVSPSTMTAQLVHAAAPVVLFLALEATTSLLRQRTREEHVETKRLEDDKAITAAAPALPVVDTASTAINASNPTSATQAPRQPSPTLRPPALPDDGAPTQKVQPGTVSTTPAPRSGSATSLKAPASTPVTNSTPQSAATPVTQVATAPATGGKPAMSLPEKIRAYLDVNPETTLTSVIGAIEYKDKKYLRRVAKKEMETRGLAVN